jgi:hypothetical protein
MRLTLGTFLIKPTFKAFKSLSKECPIRTVSFENSFNKSFCTSTSLVLQLEKLPEVKPLHRVL